MKSGKSFHHLKNISAMLGVKYANKKLLQSYIYQSSRQFCRRTYQHDFTVLIERHSAMQNINRREFLKSSGCALAAASTLNSCAGPAPTDKRPNILVIITDQQNATMMSCAGNRWLKTPNMDRLAASGVRFERAYSSVPVCIPSRFSLMTGRMPSEIHLRSNDLGTMTDIPIAVFEQGIGNTFKSAGYEAVYGGKVHLPRMNIEELGFDYLTKDERDELADTCADYIRQEHEKPFFMVASLINPHDICYMAIRDFAESAFSKQLIENGVVEVATLDRALVIPEGVGHDEFFYRLLPATTG